MTKENKFLSFVFPFRLRLEYFLMSKINIKTILRYGHLAYDIMKANRWLPLFRSTLLPPSSECLENGLNRFLRW
jgi:hypothetical protein